VRNKKAKKNPNSFICFLGDLWRANLLMVLSDPYFSQIVFGKAAIIEILGN
jgi:hypothetical protein